jgi:hypothetical protein
VLLATATRFPQQGFRLGRSAYGFQFHFEITEEILRRWVNLWRKDLEGHEVTADDILSGVKYHLPLLNRRGEELVRAFGALIHASPERELSGAAAAAAAAAAKQLNARQRRIGLNPTGQDASNPAVAASILARENAERIKEEALRAEAERQEGLRRLKDYDPASRQLDERHATQSRRRVPEPAT